MMMPPFLTSFSSSGRISTRSPRGFTLTAICSASSFWIYCRVLCTGRFPDSELNLPPSELICSLHRPTSWQLLANLEFWMDLGGNQLFDGTLPLRAPLPAYPAQFITSLAFRAPVVSFVLLSSKYSIISEISCSTILWPMFRQWRWSVLRLATSPDIRNHNASNRCAPSPLCFAIISFFPLSYPKSRNS